MKNQLQDAVALAADIEGQTLSEAALEVEINDACYMLGLALTEAEQRECFERVKVLHARRSDEQIARMERARGLRK